MKRSADRSRIYDCAFLFGLVILSGLPYLFRLGFYADDWPTHSILAQSSGHGLGASFRALSSSDPNFLMRPVQLVYLVLSFKVFGLHALPYHLFNTAVIGLVTVPFYLTLRELHMGRRLSFSIAVVFGVLPHYSTDRIWMSSQQTTFCMAFAFLGIYSMLKAVRKDGDNQTKWAFLAFIALALSLLSYEVAFGLIAGSLVLLCWMSYRDSSASSNRSVKMGVISSAVALLLLVMLAKFRRQRNVTFHGHFFTHVWGSIWHLIVQAVQFNLWTYFLHLPVILASLYRHSAFSFAAVATAAAVFCFVTAYLWWGMNSSEIPTPSACLRLILAGFALFALGYGLFISNVYTNFSTNGLSNRVAIGSAPGAACVLVAIASLACSIPRSGLVRARIFAFEMGLICGVNCLVVSGITFFWADAASQQAAILRSVAANVRSLPHGSVLLLDGFCRFSGPGIVFEEVWDATGAVQLTEGDFSIQSDVISPAMRFGKTAVETSTDGRFSDHYQYGDHLFVYNLRRQSLTVLPSKAAATLYLSEMNPSGDGGCPAGDEGDGTTIF